MLEKLVKIVTQYRKITPEIKAKILKAKCRAAIDIYELAVKYEVSPSTIYRIRNEAK